MTDKPDPIPRLLARIVSDNGGQQAVAMTRDYHAGQSLEAIAAQHNTSAATVHRRIRRLVRALDSVGYLPESWRTRDRPRRAVSEK